MVFEKLGYFEEYIVNSKSLGIIRVQETNQGIGYANSIKKITDKTIILDNKKTIKSGVEVTIIVYPFNGKRIK